MNLKKTLFILIFIINIFTITALARSHQLTELRMIENSCKCVNEWKCQCCATINAAPSFTYNQLLCGIWRFVPQTISFEVNIKWNNLTLFRTGISPDNAPPICAPIIPPVWLLACIKVSNVTQNLLLTNNDSNSTENQLLTACTNVTFISIGFTLYSSRLGCVNVNKNGVMLTNIVPIF